MTIAQLLSTLNEVFPLARAESWDKTGLQIGDAGAEVARVVVAHEVTDAVLDSAGQGAALVVYHPLIFRPLESLDFKNHTARLAARCLRAGISLISVHTALDNAPPPGALGDGLAGELGLENVAVLSPSGRETLCKIAVFVPPDALEKVGAALWAAGAGKIGNYDEASFTTRGTGTFRPLPGANPYAGTVGVREAADEFRLEVVVPSERADAAVAAMIAAHPYEEVAYDVYPLRNEIRPYGPARLGEMAQPCKFDEFAGFVQSALRAPNLRLVRGAAEEIRRVACSPGSGASYIRAAAVAGCDCLVTGDIKHHDALQAQALGLTLIDATHAATERSAVPLIANALAGWNVELCEPANPFESPKFQVQS